MRLGLVLLLCESRGVGRIEEFFWGSVNKGLLMRINVRRC
jgi:hypothetical protein